jgi:hypothetical protein
LSDFDVNKIVKYCEQIFFENWLWENKRWCTWGRVVMLAQRQEASGNSIRTNYLLCLTNFERISSPGPGPDCIS